MDKKYDNLTMAAMFQSFLHDNNCTLHDADEIIYLLISQLRYQRERLEYDTYEDYFSENRKDACNEIVENINYKALIGDSK